MFPHILYNRFAILFGEASLLEFNRLYVHNFFVEMIELNVICTIRSTQHRGQISSDVIA